MYRRPELEVKWQNLSRTDYQVTSPKSQEYNCFAWAAEESDRWWQPIPGEQFYWPEGVPQEETIEILLILGNSSKLIGLYPIQQELSFGQSGKLLQLILTLV